jgi:MFS family permease
MGLDEKLLLTPKLLYFAVGSVYYAFYIFRIQFFANYYGFGPDKAGDIVAAMTLTGFLLTPLWSSMADRLGRHRLILAGLGIATSGVFELLLIRFTNPTYNYWYALGVFSLFGGVLGGLLPLADYQILQLLTHKFKADRTFYGRQRMMGTISYGLTTLLIGYLTDRFGVTVPFYLLPIFSLILVASLMFFGYPDATRSNTDEGLLKGDDVKKDIVDKESIAPPPSVTIFFKDGHFLFFLLVVFVTGCGRQVLQVYLTPFLDKTLHMSSSQAGLAVVSSTVFSVIFLFIGSTLIAKLGTSLMLILGMITMGIRLGCYVFIPQSPNSAWIVYAIELLNGVAFSFTHLAGVKIVADFAPPGREATAQAIYTSCYMQLPAVLVSFIGGRIFKEYGGVKFFGWTSEATLAFSAIVALKYAVFSGKKRIFRGQTV